MRHTIFNEDMIFAARLIQSGRAVAYCAQARVIHSHNYSSIQQFHRNFDLGVSQADHPEVFDCVKSESEGIRMVKQTAGYLSLIHICGRYLSKAHTVFSDNGADSCSETVPFCCVRKA